MTPHLLDQPIRSALATRHRHLAQGGPLAFRYPADISPFAAVNEESSEALEALAALTAPGGTVLVVQRHPHPVPPGMAAVSVFEAVQMLAETVAAPDGGLDILELSDADAPEMLALATLTRPGPYAARTHAFGGYIGIRAGGRLAAMAGRRLHLPGLTEISAVCTHPDFRGRGYAGYLTRVVAARIGAEGNQPFLHTYAGNSNAIRLYEDLGFVHRTKLWGSVFAHG